MGRVVNTNSTGKVRNQMMDIGGDAAPPQPEADA